MTLVIERKPKRKLTQAPRPALPTSPLPRPARKTELKTSTVCANDACPDPLSGKIEFHTHVGSNYCPICGEYETELFEDGPTDE